MIEPVIAQTGSDLTAVANGVNAVWVLTVSFLIFFMQLGFSLLEAGQVRAKNVANVLMKNMMDWSLGVLVYFLAGNAIAAIAAGLTAPGGVSVAAAFAYVNDPTQWTTWLFGAVFAMTAATIVSGAVAERLNFKAYLFYSIGITAVIYPVIQGFAWGGGLLSGAGFLGQVFGTGYEDFAGATVVHMLGGIAGLVGAYMVGPRRGRYDGEGNSLPIPGHSVTFAMAGTLMLAFGWYGFNVGTQGVLSGIGSGTIVFHGTELGRVALNTTLAMGAGAVAASLATTYLEGKPDPLFAANGLLAGLVAITGACVHVTWWGGIAIGVIGGVQTPFVYRWVVDRLKIDDVCGVFAVHGSAGAIGTFLIPVFAVGGFSAAQLGMQFAGILTIAVWTVVTSYLVFKLADVTVGLNVSAEEESEGLDIGEHGIEAYPEFVDSGNPLADGGTETYRLVGDGGANTGSGIKLVMAVIRPDRLGEVKKALAEVGAPSLTVTNVSGRGSQPSTTEQWRGEEYVVDLHQKVKVECVVADIPADEVAEAIRDAAATGEPGDGKVFVQPVESALQVRTGKTGTEAV